MIKKSLVFALAAAIAGSALAADNPATYPLKDARTKKTVTLGSLKGKFKAIYIDMFAKWCGPCQKAIPEVKKLNSEYGGKGVAFIGLDVWERGTLQNKWQSMQDDIKARSINYRVLFDPAEQGK